MAKNNFLLLLIFTASVSFGQVKIGLIGGPQTANITEKNNIAGWDSTSGKYYSGKSGFHVGLMAEIPFGPWSRFYFQPAVTYSAKGRKYVKSYETASSDSFYTFYTNQSLTTQYIDIPLNIAFKLPLSPKKTTNFIASAGPYLSLFYNGKKITSQRDEFESNSSSNSNIKNSTEELQVGKKDDSYRTFGYGVNGRAGFELGNITVTAFYSQGMDNLYYAPYKGSFNHKVFGASLGIWLGQIKEPLTIRDKDKDGITDDKDACPSIAGTTITNGCPDKDADGIADNKDKCIDVAGLAKYNGCPVPDADNDSVNDEADKCPLVAGLARYDGCPVPDTDNDGINNENDKCPAIAGVARYNGCPVPDTDKDAINDEEDKCPDQAGTAANNGCPLIKEEIKKQVGFAAENIFFLSNSSVLQTRSYPPLNTVADILVANPNLRIIINGYTDNTGSEITNLAISGERALSVKKYLVSKGIEPRRIDFNGYGEAHPVAENTTAAGRTKNRRVELKLEP